MRRSFQRALLLKRSSWASVRKWIAAAVKKRPRQLTTLWCRACFLFDNCSLRTSKKSSSSSAIITFWASLWLCDMVPKNRLLTRPPSIRLFVLWKELARNGRSKYPSESLVAKCPPLPYVIFCLMSNPTVQLKLLLFFFLIYGGRKNKLVVKQIKILSCAVTFE